MRLGHGNERVHFWDLGPAACKIATPGKERDVLVRLTGAIAITLGLMFIGVWG